MPAPWTNPPIDARALALRLAHFCFDGDVGGIKRTLALGADPNTPCSTFLRIPTWARIQVRKQGVRDPQSRDKTPLMLAAMAGSLEGVELLLSRGADASVLSPSGESALSCAAEFGHADCFEKLLTVDHGRLSLERALDNSRYGGWPGGDALVENIQALLDALALDEIASAGVVRHSARL